MEPLRIYFGITIILSDRLDGPGQGRRGRFLSCGGGLRHGSRADGSSKPRIILRHMLPSFASHVIASLTLAVPAMILAETALSFLGLGLQPPIVSWGVLLQEAQNIRSRRHRAVAPAARVRRDNRGPGPELHGRRPERLGRSLCPVESEHGPKRRAAGSQGTQDSLLPRRGGRKGRGRRGPQGPARRDPVRGRGERLRQECHGPLHLAVDRPGRIVEGEILFSHTPRRVDAKKDGPRPIHGRFSTSRPWTPGARPCGTSAARRSR